VSRTFVTSSVANCSVCTLTVLVPMVATFTSSRPGRARALTAFCTVATVEALTATGARNSTPPLNSMPRFRPRNRSARIAIAMAIPEIRYHRLRWATNS